MQLRANHLTISRIVLLPIPCALVFGGQIERLAGLAIFIALGATDWWDGKLARQQGPTVLGGLLDPIADKMFLAFTYLPLTRIEGENGSGVSALPLWLVAAIYLRDLCVTSLRSITATHDVEFHTATLAKFKTAIQMGAGAFLMWAIVWQDNRPVWIAGYAGSVVVIVALAAFKAAKKRPVGARVWTQVGAFSAALVVAILFDVTTTLMAIAVAVLAVTLVSGAQYIVRVVRGLAEAGWPAKPGEALLSLAETIAPVAAVTLFAIPSVPAWAPIGMLTAELGMGGLANLLATEKIRRGRAASWLRCLALIALTAVGWSSPALSPTFDLAPWAAMVTALLSGAYCAQMFVAHRKIYMR